jgi:hypothetical protein
MKKLMILFLAATVFSCETSVETTSEQAGLDPQVAVDVLNDYVKSCNELRDSGKWVENHSQLTKEFKNDYKKLIKEAYEDDPEMGLGFDPIFNAQDYSEKGYELSSFDSKTGLVVLQGVDYPDYKVKLLVKIVDNKCLVDGAGVIRM